MHGQLRRIPTEPLPDVAPDLAVEVVCAGNPARETARKSQDYYGLFTELDLQGEE